MGWGPRGTPIHPYLRNPAAGRQRACGQTRLGGKMQAGAPATPSHPKPSLGAASPKPRLGGCSTLLPGQDSVAGARQMAGWRTVLSTCDPQAGIIQRAWRKVKC